MTNFSTQMHIVFKLELTCLKKNMDTKKKKPFWQITWLICACVESSSTARASCHVQERLNNLNLKHPILLPQVQHPHNLTLQRNIWKQGNWWSSSCQNPSTSSFVLVVTTTIFITVNSCYYPVLYWTMAEVFKSSCDVFGEPWAKHILVRSKLVSGLPDDGIHHVEACYLVLRLTL